jgi:capsular polysaccharide biosynthesis protein
VKKVARLVRRVGRRLLTPAPAPEASLATGVPLTVVEGATDTVRDVWCAPAFGVVFDDDGRVLASTAREAQRYTPDLSRLPHVRLRDGVSLFSPPATTPEIARGAVFAGWSGLHNYAHFLLASLPALLALPAPGAPAIVPPLARWQADLLTLIGETPLVVDGPLVRLGEVVLAPKSAFPEAIDPRVIEVRNRVVAQVEAWADRRRIYLSRRDSLKAVMADEAELETALAARGFVIIRPESILVREMVGVVRGAEMIVSPSGVALANILFCTPGAKVIEIRPPDAADTWTRDLAELVGAEWRGFDAAGSREAVEIPLDPRLRPDSAFSWKADVAAVLAFLDERA